MDRRNFIKKTSLLSTATVLTPTIAFNVLKEKNKSQVEVVKVLNKQIENIDEFEVKTYCSSGKLIGVYLVEPDYEINGVYGLNLTHGLENGKIVQIRG